MSEKSAHPDSLRSEFTLKHPIIDDESPRKVFNSARRKNASAHKAGSFLRLREKAVVPIAFAPIKVVRLSSTCARARLNLLNAASRESTELESRKSRAGLSKGLPISCSFFCAQECCRVRAKRRLEFSVYRARLFTR